MADQLTTVPTVFKFGENPVRTIDRDGEIWFVAGDVAQALEYSMPSAMVRYLDDDEKGVSIMHTPGGAQELSIINESGLYSAVLRSRKQEAKKFKKWVTSEVLPAIRKTGRYEAHPASSETPRLEDWHSKAIAGAITKRVQDRLGGKNETRAHRAGRSYCYAKLQRRFGVISTHNLAARDFDEAMRYIECMALEGDWLPASKRDKPALEAPASPLSGWRFLCTFAENGQPQFTPVAKDAFVIPASELRDMVTGAMQHFVQGVKLLADTEYKYELDKLAPR